MKKTMYIFRSIHEIINTIFVAKGLLVEMFEKRKVHSFRYSDALTLLKEDENRLKILIEKEIIHQNGNFVELDARFLDFFELLLEANEEINTATVEENIEYLHELMDYYLKEKIQSRKESYVRNIKITFQKLARVTIRNIINLQHNIDNAFKHEPTYQIKIAKLQNLDKKRINIQRLIDSTEHLILHEERDFFRQATDEELTRILGDWGEVETPWKVANCLVKARAAAPVTTTAQLVGAVKPCTPKKDEAKFLTKLFQALRIEVNGEMEALKMALEQSLRVLKPGGRLVVISYHSLEDRLVKNFMRSGNFSGQVEKDFFGRSQAPFDLVTRKAVTPSAEELDRNPRSRSAKLRAAVKR